jgi:hypothetical protein
VILMAAAAVLLAGAGGAARVEAPEVALVLAPTITFPAETDSNSPAFWAGGRLHVFNSLQHPYLSEGRSVGRLEDPVGVIFQGGVLGPRWMEAVIRADDGTLYGYYHHEPGGVCGALTKTMPKIGAARSVDDGLTWTDLGILLTSSALDKQCETANLYFVGGEGDFSAILDREGSYVYFLFSSYSPRPEEQGIAIARMPWSRRDRPAGAVVRWRDGAWSSPGLAGLSTPVHGVEISWHEPRASAFWGPSVHWNTHLRLYVMLMARAIDSAWNTEGIYVSYADRLDDPAAWTPPHRIHAGGTWYPQVMGLERGAGTDSQAGEYARFFMGGRSDHYIRFVLPAAAAAAR